MISKDLLWKGIIEDLLEEFLQFFFTDYFHLIDFSKGVQFLDQELAQLYTDSDSRLRRADKLIKIFLNNGHEHWILIHLEVQGYNDPQVGLRMFQTAYRLKDKYNVPVSALVLYTYRQNEGQTDYYEENFWGTQLIYHFNTYKLWKQDIKVLEESDNIFSLALAIAWYNLKKASLTDAALFEIKLQLIRSGLARGIDKNRLRNLIAFIQAYVNFEDSSYTTKLEEVILEISVNKKPMGVIEVILEETRRMGLEEGMEKGLEKGLEKGEELSIIKICINCLKGITFQEGRLSYEDISLITSLSIDRIREIHKILDTQPDIAAKDLL